MLFYHYVFGKNSRKKADNFSSYFILGSAVAVGALICLAFFLTIDSPILRWILSGILVALGIVSLFFYFRRGRGTSLFLPRKGARSLIATAKNIKSPSDAFMLGAMCELPELIFSLPLYVAIAVGIGGFTDGSMRTCLALVVVLCNLLPLFTMWGLFKNHRNLADIQRMRAKNKSFCRLFMAGCYFVLAAILISSEFLQ